jgi:hypothetical protein
MIPAIGSVSTSGVSGRGHLEMRHVEHEGDMVAWLLLDE